MESTYIEDSDSDDLAEVFSPPRVVPFANLYNLNGFSMDLLTGTDLQTLAGRMELDRALTRKRPLMVILSPPCTMYSSLNWSLNHSRLPSHTWNERLRKADALLRTAMRVAAQQVSQGRYFVFEHPACAKSWSTDMVQTVFAMPGVRRATFDQCRYGLVGPSGQPMRKRTSFLTNCSFVFTEFDGKYCQCTGTHQRIIGTELGEPLAAWAAHYPPRLCRALARCVRDRRLSEA